MGLTAKDRAAVRLSKAYLNIGEMFLYIPFARVHKGIAKIRGLRYGEGKRAALDVFRPAGTSDKLPLFVYIHGGGFVSGLRPNRRFYCYNWVEAGYVAANIGYDYALDAEHPEHIREIFKGIEFVLERAEEFGIDTRKIVVAGDSAGGYYAAMLACICLNKGLQDKMGVSTDLRFGGAVLNCGIYDVATALKNKYPFDLGGKLLKDFAGIRKDEVENYEWKDLCSVLGFVNEDFPVSFITHAQKDIFCGGQADALMKILNEKGVHNEEFHSTGLLDNHCFSLNWKSKAARKNNDLVADFMKRFAEGKI